MVKIVHIIIKFLWYIKTVNVMTVSFLYLKFSTVSFTIPSSLSLKVFKNGRLENAIKTKQMFI